MTGRRAVSGRPAQRRSSPKPSSSGIITSAQDQVRRVPRAATRSASSPSADREHVVALAQQPAHVLAHVGVVVGDEHPRAGSVGDRDARRRRARAPPAPRRPRPLPARRAASAAPPRRRPARAGRRGRRRRAGRRCGPPAGARVPSGMRHGERGALARARSRRRHGAAVQPHQLLDQREADAGALVGAAARALDPVEALEQPRQLGRGDADAGVARRSARPRGLRSAERDRDPALEGELEGVGEQVEDDLLPHVAVDVDRLGRAAGSRPRSASPARSTAERKLAGQLGGERGEIGRLVARLRPGRPRCGRSRAAC